MAEQIVKANEPRTTGPSYDTWPASLPQISYVLADGGQVCVTCANGGNGSEAALDDDTDRQWRIVGAQINNGPTQCDHCSRMIVNIPAE